MLEDLGLEDYMRKKLSLSKILQIEGKTITDQLVECKSELPWYFLKKLMMVNVTSRNVKCTSESKSACQDSNDTLRLDLTNLVSTINTSDILNPLDLITAIFLCSDGFVQQELALKMSMCQFSVPLLLPNCDTERCTLMLWAMRDIVKKYRPPALAESKGFIEERIVLTELPLVSFVRLGECSLSKSEILNKLLSNSQQYHDTFVHHNMECGDSPRKISNGLTEITWYLPCGNKNMDIFSEPVAIANLRGDIASFETQFSFLCQTSAAIFVFFDDPALKFRLLTQHNSKAQIFLVGKHQSQTFNLNALEEVATKLSLTNSNIILKSKSMNDADFVKCLRKTVRYVVEHSTKKNTLEQMVYVAHELGIMVDEDTSECQTGKQNADAIIAEIQDTLQYKEDQLPLQGQIWKELTSVEKEEFRLQKVGSQNIENYKSDLQEQIKELRKKQNSYDMSKAMTCFVNAISSPGKERCFFLKWLRMNLDNLSRIKLSGLRDLYKEKCKESENKEEIKEIDRQLSSSSLGVEHFFREMGQIYEASLSLPETDPSRQQLQHLPKLCAQLLLDGFPLELVDGDASNIPLRWVSDVLSQLNDLVSPKNKIVVVTVLGVQSTGKSTLLNTMFGVQFAVSSGRCTRGAFMLLIKVSEDFKKVLNCDFMVIIDTEGLKSPELAQLDNSYEHDNELATLVVGLSDITVINIAMENSTEMKDILQIVVHAFLRMKEVGKKPQCQFVHQNVSDVSAHEKNLRDRKLLLEQLNEMTQAAAKMEKKEENKSFTDVMEYNPDTGNCYIPGLWNGNPPMAPVNVGYSEAVYELKKNLIQQLGKCGSTSNDILEFREWIISLWNTVKHENFIFSFRNSLVADAYMRLCTEYNKWEWEFKKEMYTWVTNAETRISNFGTVAATSELSDMEEFINQLKSEAASELSKWETTLLVNLSQYFKKTEGHVYLVEGYKEEFSNSVKCLRREIENSVFNQLMAAADINFNI
ncbi:LOW QUALITY PROTEIN: up-regulator of cell proliferation-like [Anableps anableps]